MVNVEKEMINFNVNPALMAKYYILIVLIMYLDVYYVLQIVYIVKVLIQMIA